MNRKKEKSIKYNFIMNAILSVSSIVFPLITFPYVSRVLLPEGTGKVTFATSLIYYFLMIAQLGIPTYGVSVCAKVRDDREKLSRVVHELLIINLIMTAVAYAALAVTLFCFPVFYAERPLYLLMSLTILFDAMAMEWMYKALEQYDYITVRSLIFRTVALIATFVLVHSTDDYHIYGAITLFSTVAAGIFNFVNARKYIEFRYLGGYDIRSHLKPVVVFFLIVCASAIYTHMDTLMLGLIKSEAHVGYYNVSVKVRNILVGVVAALGTVLLPRTSYYVEQGMMAEFRAICSKALRFVWILAVPLGLFFVLYAKECVLILSGPEYAASVLPMQILMPTLLFIGIGNIFGVQMLVPLGKEKTILISEAVSAAVNVTVNSLLIPKYGVLGAAVGTLIAELLVTTIQGFALKAYVVDMFAALPYAKTLLAFLVAAAGSLWIKLLGLGHEITFIFGAFLFFAEYFVMLLVTKEPFVLSTLTQVLDMAGKLLEKIGLRK